VTARRLVYHPGVEEDLDPILVFYAERDAALPGRFRGRLQEQIERIVLFPESGAVLFEEYRRVLLKRFPTWRYGVNNDRIDVLAIVGVRRDPAWIEAAVAARVEE